MAFFQWVHVLMVTNVGFETPSCARSQMMALGKSSTLYYSLEGGIFLDQQCAIEEVNITVVNI